MQAQRNCTITTPACKNPTWGRWAGAWNDVWVWREKSSILRHTENTAIELTNKRAFLLYIPLARSSFRVSFTECGLAARRIYCIWPLRARQRLCPRNSQNSDAIYYIMKLADFWEVFSRIPCFGKFSVTSHILTLNRQSSHPVDRLLWLG